MALLEPKDRVLESSTTTGTGTYTLDAAVTGYQTAAAAGAVNGTTGYYFAEDVDAGGVPLGGWETGLGTWGTGGTLARTTIHTSSNSNLAVSWAAGTRRISFAALTATALATKQNTTLNVQNKTGAYTVVAADNGTVINCTSGTFTITLTAAATLGSGFNCWIRNTGTGVITVDPNGAELLEGSSTRAISKGDGWRIICDGSGWSFADSPVLWAEKWTTAGAPVATGDRAVAVGHSYASGADSFAAAIGNNTSSYGAQGANSIAMGKQAKATASYSSAFGYLSAATGAGAFVFGILSVASGAYSVSAGYICVAAGDYSLAFGSNAQANQLGKYAYASGQFAASGDAQTGTMVLRTTTTNGTATVITSDAGAAGTTNQVILTNNQAMTFEALITARQNTTGDTASWNLSGCIKRGANAAATSLVGSIVSLASAADAGAVLWTAVASADTTNGGLKITVTGEASKTIRWSATVFTNELAG